MLIFRLETMGEPCLKLKGATICRAIQVPLGLESFYLIEGAPTRTTARQYNKLILGGRLLNKILDTLCMGEKTSGLAWTEVAELEITNEITIVGC